MRPHLITQLQRFIPLISFGFVVLAIALAKHQFTAYHIAHARDLIFSIPLPVLGKALLFTSGSYLIATCYDQLALRNMGKTLAPGKTIFAAFISFAVSHNAGHPLISGTSLRYRFYPRWGIKGGDVITIAVLNTITYGLGLSSSLIASYAITQHVAEPLPVPGINIVMGLMAVLYAGYWICLTWWRPTIRIKTILLRLPDARFTLAQIAIGSIDVFFSGMVLYSMLSTTLAIPLSEFFVIYVLSLMLGSFSQLPGGLGVFEGMFLHLLSAYYPGADILASLVLYRIVYYFLPLALAALLLLAFELKNRPFFLRWGASKRFYHP